MALLAVSERRAGARLNAPRRMAIRVLRPEGPLPARSVNVSDGGLCVRLAEILEVRSQVRLLVSASMSAAQPSLRSLECTGRVAWVVQRLDLRALPPFLFDVGIQLENPPPLLRQFLQVRPSAAARRPGTPARVLEIAALKGRVHTARLERTTGHPQPWHLMIFVEGVPCFSGRYASALRAREAWAQFKRRGR
jgi:hypothetical protein